MKMKSKGNRKKVQKKVSIESKERQNTHTKGTTKKAKRGGDYRQLVFRADRIGTDRIGSDRIGSQLSVSQLRAKSTSIGKKGATKSAVAKRQSRKPDPCRKNSPTPQGTDDGDTITRKKGSKISSFRVKEGKSF